MGMRDPAIELDINDLAQRTGFTPRTIRYYIQRGLLSKPENKRGPGPHYGEGHVNQLRMIDQLRRQQLSLDEIETRLRGMNPAEVAQQLADVPDKAAALPRRSIGPESKRSEWDRVELAPGVEIHIRRPLARYQEQRVERLLGAAWRIFPTE